MRAHLTFLILQQLHLGGTGCGGRCIWFFCLLTPPLLASWGAARALCKSDSVGLALGVQWLCGHNLEILNISSLILYLVSEENEMTERVQGS